MLYRSTSCAPSLSLRLPHLNQTYTASCSVITDKENRVRFKRNPHVLIPMHKNDSEPEPSPLLPDGSVLWSVLSAALELQH